MKIVIVDYGMGNVHSIVGAMSYLGFSDVAISNHNEQILGADRLILPGVGNFARAIQNIKSLDLDKSLSLAHSEKSIPILGICLGMQLLGLSSTESGTNQGLGYFNGTVTRFESGTLAVPHVGYNQVSHTGSMRIFEGIKNNSDFYFTHSYYLKDYEIKNVVSQTKYDLDFVSSVNKGNVYGVQFHPEKSQSNGLQILKNFYERC